MTGERLARKPVRRRWGSWKPLLLLLVILLSKVACAEGIYALVPLRNETAGGGEAWVGLGIVLKLQEYLAAGQKAEFVPRSRLEEASGPSRVDLSQPFDDEQAPRLRDALGADCLLWGRYEVQGKTAVCEIHLLHSGRRTRDTFNVSGRLTYFNALVRKIAEHVHRLERKAVSAQLRRRWLEERPLGEEYRYYVEALSPALEAEKRIESLRKYLTANPSDLSANLWLAEWTHGQNTEEAMRIYREVLEWAPDSGLAHANLAYLLAMRGENDAARSHFEAAIRCEDPYPELYFNYGNLLHRLSLDTLAIRIYRQGIEHFPDYAPLYYHLALLYDERDLSAETSETYREAYRLDPSLRPDVFASHVYLEDRWIPMKEE